MIKGVFTYKRYPIGLPAYMCVLFVLFKPQIHSNIATLTNLFGFNLLSALFATFFAARRTGFLPSPLLLPWLANVSPCVAQ